MSNIHEVNSAQEWTHEHEHPANKAHRVVFPEAFSPDNITDITSLFFKLPDEAQGFLTRSTPLVVTGQRALLLPPKVAILERVKLRALDTVDPERHTTINLQNKSSEADGRLHTRGFNALGNFATLITMQDMMVHFSSLTADVKDKIENGSNHAVKPGSGRQGAAAILRPGSLVSFRPSYFGHEHTTGDAYQFSCVPPTAETTEKPVKSTPTTSQDTLYEADYTEMSPGTPDLRYFDIFASKIPLLKAYHPRYTSIKAAQIMEGITA